MQEFNARDRLIELSRSLGRLQARVRRVSREAMAETDPKRRTEAARRSSIVASSARTIAGLVDKEQKILRQIIDADIRAAEVNEAAALREKLGRLVALLEQREDESEVDRLSCEADEAT